MCLFSVGSRPPRTDSRGGSFVKPHPLELPLELETLFKLKPTPVKKNQRGEYGE